MRPIGPATAIATSMIRNVPAKMGTAPNAPDEPAWSALRAVCGDHCKPNKNSLRGTCSKKRQLSNASDITMPNVVKTATVDNKISTAWMKRSTCVLARKSAVIRLEHRSPIAAAKPSKTASQPKIKNPATVHTARRASR